MRCDFSAINPAPQFVSWGFSLWFPHLHIIRQTWHLLLAQASGQVPSLCVGRVCFDPSVFAVNILLRKRDLDSWSASVESTRLLPCVLFIRTFTRPTTAVGSFTLGHDAYRRIKMSLRNFCSCFTGSDLWFSRKKTCFLDVLRLNTLQCRSQIGLQ